jgi:hypothetical protein
MLKKNLPEKICEKLKIPYSDLVHSNGGSIKKDFYTDVYSSIIGIPVPDLTKPELARRIADHLGIQWNPKFTSEDSNSGGGDTVTGSFLQALYDAL